MLILKLICFSPNEPCTPVMEGDSAVSFTDDMLKLHYDQRYYTDYKRSFIPLMIPHKQMGRKKGRKQKSCLKGKFIVFLLKLLQQCCSCGQEVELNTSVRGTYIANGKWYLYRWTCTKLAVPDL